MTTRIFIRNPHGSAHISKMASKIGLVFGETEATRKAPAKAGFVGDTYLLRGQLRAAGARWDGECKAWVFDSWDAALAALKTIVEA